MTLFERDEYEWGVVFVRAPDAPHRAGMTEDEARKWVEEWEDTGLEPDAVAVIRRRCAPWERA